MSYKTIREWLSSINPELLQYESSFRMMSINMALVPELSEGDLLDIGISDQAHRTQVFQAILRLNQSSSNPLNQLEPSLNLTESSSNSSPNNSDSVNIQKAAQATSIREWLKLLGPEYTPYESMFKIMSINNINLVSGMCENDLIDLGVQDSTHRNNMLQSILLMHQDTHLQNNNDNSNNSNHNNTSLSNGDKSSSSISLADLEKIKISSRAKSIREWLNALGSPFLIYESSFRIMSINMALVEDLSEGDLLDIGVTDSSHRLLMCESIKEMKNNSSVENSGLNPLHSSINPNESDHFPVNQPASDLVHVTENFDDVNNTFGDELMSPSRVRATAAMFSIPETRPRTSSGVDLWSNVKKTIKKNKAENRDQSRRFAVSSEEVPAGPDTFSGVVTVISQRRTATPSASLLLVSEANKKTEERIRAETEFIETRAGRQEEKRRLQIQQAEADKLKREEAIKWFKAFKLQQQQNKTINTFIENNQNVILPSLNNQREAQTIKSSNNDSESQKPESNTEANLSSPPSDFSNPTNITPQQTPNSSTGSSQAKTIPLNDLTVSSRVKLDESSNTSSPIESRPIRTSIPEPYHRRLHQSNDFTQERAKLLNQTQHVRTSSIVKDQINPGINMLDNKTDNKDDNPNDSLSSPCPFPHEIASPSPVLPNNSNSVSSILNSNPSPSSRPPQPQRKPPVRPNSTQPRLG